MRNLLSLISKIHEKGNKFIIDGLKENNASELVPSHGDILITLYLNGRITMKDIAEKIHRTKPTVTVLVNKLEKLGYVKRETNGDDGRCTYINLTKKGEAFKPVFKKISDDLNEILYKNLSDKEADTLQKLLEKVI